MTRWVCLLAVSLIACGGGGEIPPAAAPAAPAAEPLAGPPGARSFKSGPIQVTADGRFVWTANTDNDSVSRMDTRDFTVREFPLPEPGTRDAPRTLSVAEDGSEVWVACHDSDRVYVLDGADGKILRRIDLPWGSGPCGIAIDPGQATVLVTLLRRAAIVEIDRPTRTVAQILEPVWRTPVGIAFEKSGDFAWITHRLVEGGEHPKISRVDCTGAAVRLAGDVRVGATDPRASKRLAAPHDIAEGGYLTFRGHLAQRPGVAEMWLPTQYNNIHEDRFSPDSTVQATIRRLRTDTLAMQNSVDTKIVMTAVHAHETTGNNEYRGPGWNAQVAGPIDIAFSADGAFAYVVCELSNDVVIVPTDTTTVRPAGAAPLPEVAVGDRPVGIAVSPIDGGAYVLNQFSRDVSVIDVAKAKEVRRVAVTPVTGEPFDAAFLKGAKLFHTSDDPRISSNGKIACASCHADGETDGRVWGFHVLGARSGQRSTPTLLGLGRSFGPPDPASGFGQLHRSGDRDEVQDFEHTFRNETMRGTGFLAAPQEPLGAPNAGRDADLDALAHYLLNLPAIPRSPFRAPDGSLSERAVRGAQLFVASRCADCHVPETGFVDFKFHDVGQRRTNNEEELNQGSRAPYQWHVATPTLVGLFATPGYEGVPGWADDIETFLDQIAADDKHGDIRGLAGQQKADLAAFLLSIDGNMTAAEVRGARDTTPPRVARIAVSSLTRVDVWFSEPVTKASAEALGNWRVNDAPVAAAAWDARNGDRVTLTTVLARNTTVTVVASGVEDTAGNAVGAADRASVALGDTLTVTFGASGYENYDVAVHDSSMAGPGLSTWNHDAPWLFAANKGFVRFEWQAAAQTAGVAAADQIVDASFSILAEFGYGHPIEIRRCLQAWSDAATGGDWNKNATGAPTWRDHSHPDGRWNQAGAQRTAAGVEGRAVGDYDGPHDTARTPDATAAIGSTTERIVFTGLADALRFWFANPTVDYGYVLSFAPGAPDGASLKAWRHEHGAMDKGPVLAVTFRLP